MKALIVDDERLARQELRRLLSSHREVEVAGEARTGEEALDLVGKLAPDVLLLDIQMPGMTGFEVNALDYLLKPVAPERLAARSPQNQAAG